LKFIRSVQANFTKRSERPERLYVEVDYTDPEQARRKADTEAARQYLMSSEYFDEVFGEDLENGTLPELGKK
jgi:hypothetical protein